jgi:hypothetical protein
MFQWLPTDQQRIERIRRWQKYRRPMGIAAALVSFAGCILIFYYLVQFRSEITMGFSPEEIQAIESRDSKAAQAANNMDGKLNFDMGFALGLSFAIGIWSTAGLGIMGIMMILLKNRKDQLLLKCWDRHATSHDGNIVGETQ